MSKDESIKRLQTALPYVLEGVREVEAEHPGALVMFTIAATLPDGRGKIILELKEPKQFLDDLALALDITLTEETAMAHKAESFLQRFGLRNER